jgi:hypothetical protein
MKKNIILETMIRKMLFEEFRMIKIRPGSDAAVFAGWKNGAAEIGNERTTFEIVARTTDKNENIIDEIYGAIAINKTYGSNSKFAKTPSSITPYGTKYMYVMGENIAILPKRQKYNVWICNLEILYKIVNQIDQLLGLDDKVYGTVESFGPKYSIGNVPLYDIATVDKMIQSIKQYMKSPEIGGKLKITNIGSEYNLKNNTITINDNKIFPDLKALDKNYTPETDRTYTSGELSPTKLSKTVTIPDDESNNSGILGFIGTGTMVKTGTGDVKFLPIKGSMSIYRLSDNKIGKFEGTFKDGYIDNGTITFDDMEPYTGQIPLNSLQVVNIRTAAKGDQRSFTVDFDAPAKSEQTKSIAPEVIDTTSDAITYPNSMKFSDGVTYNVYTTGPTDPYVYIYDKKTRVWLYADKKQYEKSLTTGDNVSFKTIPPKNKKAYEKLNALLN